MPESAISTERQTEPNAVGEPRVFDKLRELVGSGYVPDPRPRGDGGILLCHDHAPDLILHQDGRIDLPPAQRPKPALAAPAAAPAAAPERPRLAKGRTLLFIFMAIGFWFFSMFLTASILSS